VVSIFDNLYKKIRRYFSNNHIFTDIELKETLKGIKSELDEHLEAINENTNEIQTNYSCTNETNDKLERLAERMDKLELYIQSHSNFIVEDKIFEVLPLTKTEQHVFLVIYALEDEKGLVSHTDISRKTGLPSYVVSEYITRLVEKGVPLIRKFVNNIPYLKINPDFKRLQAMENILMIDTAQKELINFN